VHGGFTAGLMTVVVLLAAAGAIRLWRPTGHGIDEPVPGWPALGGWSAAVALAALATLVNPYGTDLHREILESLNDRYMLEHLSEWQPFSLEIPAGRYYAVYLSALLLGLATVYRRIEPVRWALCAVFFAFSLRHWRNIPLFLIVSLPLLAEIIEAWLRVAFRWVAVMGRPDTAVRAAKGALVAGAAVLAASLGPEHLRQVATAAWHPRQYFQGAGYPMAAVEWVEVRGAPGRRMYNDYGWGGFLLWWLPGEKIFIDGRMPAWRIGDRSIFPDYLAVTAGSPPDLRVLDKYGVDWALLPVGAPLEAALGGDPGWERLYRDEVAAIYRRARPRAG
jgi:hypothetical protein